VVVIRRNTTNWPVHVAGLSVHASCLCISLKEKSDDWTEGTRRESYGVDESKGITSEVYVSLVSEPIGRWPTRRSRLVLYLRKSPRLRQIVLVVCGARASIYDQFPPIMEPHAKSIN
jgi:hypothetical protein